MPQTKKARVGKTKKTAYKKNHLKLDPKKIGNEAEMIMRALKKKVVGQDEAVEAIVSAFNRYRAELNSPERPVGTFLFLGPTGVGKTRLVEALAEVLFNDRKAVIKIDCGEFQHGHEISKLIGSPPGYIGYGQTSAMLTQANLDKHHTGAARVSLVLFDEIEKASHTLRNILLGILDKATLTLGNNKKVDFSKVFIFMTSNLGTRDTASALDQPMGFSVLKSGSDIHNRRTNVISERISLGAVRKKFTPEFINRIDKIVVFRQLGPEELNRILDIELVLLHGRFFENVKFALRLSGTCRQKLLELGDSAIYGARHFKRVLDEILVNPVSNLIASNQIVNGDIVRVRWDKRQNFPVFEVIEVMASLYKLASVAGIELAGSEPIRNKAVLPIKPLRKSRRR